MSEQLKYIVDGLNDVPYNKNLNLISFDSLQPIQLLQILNDVMTNINPQQASDVRDEDPESRVMRMLQFLRVMKYKPKTDGGNVSAFRQGIVQGDKPVIYPILQWLLEQGAELKQRAYLARFLVKLDIPGEVLIDNEVSENHQLYLNLIEDFKEVHKESEQIKGSGMSAAEIKKDILSMEEEQEQLRKRIDRVKKRVDPVANKDNLLYAAKQLRQERERESNLADQQHAQKTSLSHAEQKINRMQMQIRDFKASSIGITPDGLIKRLEEENQVNVYLTTEKIPKELENKKQYIDTLQRVADEPAMGQNELEVLNQSIKELSSEVNELVEKRMMRNDPIDDKLSVFRQQAAVIANKKKSAAEDLQEAMDEYHNAEGEIEERKDKLKDSDDVQMLKGDEFKRYVNKLRGISNIYKKKRQEISDLQAEVGVLSRSEEILKSRDDNSQAFLSNLEAKHGVSGFHDAQEELEKVSTMKGELDEKKGKTLEEMSQLVVQLTNSISEKKNSLAPVIKELRPLRQQAQELSVEYEERKGTYETTAAGLESNMSKLDQEVKALREEVLAEESRYHYMESMIEVLEVQQQRIDEEIKSYVNTDGSKKSLRDKYSQRIHEQEVLGKQLREKQKYLRENHAPNMRQMKMWTDLTQLLKCKKESLSGPTTNTAEDPALYDEQDHLVL